MESASSVARSDVLEKSFKVSPSEGDFLPKFPREIVAAKIWPLLMYGLDALENFVICTTLREVCVGWCHYVSSTLEWRRGMLAWQDCKRDRHYSSGDESGDLDSNDFVGRGYIILPDERFAWDEYRASF